MAKDLRRRLKLAVDAAVALLEATRIPGEIEMKEVVAVGLEIETLTGGVGGDEDAERLGGRIGVEGFFDFLAAVGRSRAAEDGDAAVGRVGTVDCGREHLLEVAGGVFPFGENQDADGGPGGRRARGRATGEADGGAAVLLEPGDEGADAGVGAVTRVIGNRGHLVEEVSLAGGERGGAGGRGGSERGDGVVFDRRQFVGVEFGTVVVGGWGRDRGVGGGRGDREPGLRVGSLRRFGGPDLLHRAAVDEERPIKGFGAGEEPRLEADDHEHRLGCLPAGGFLREPGFAEVAVFGEEPGELELGGVGSEAVDVELLHDPLRKPAHAGADIFLETADHHRIEVFNAHLHAAGEPLRVEDLQKRGKAVGVAVVGRGREEEPVLEPRGKVADGPRDPAVDGVAVVGGRGGVVGFVEDEERAWAECAEPVTKRAGVGLVDQEFGRDEPAGVDAPGVHRPAAFLADPLHREAVEDIEDEAEAGFEFALPLRHHRRRADDDDVLDATAEEQLAGDEAGLDRLAEADVVGDEEIHPRQEQGFPQGLELVGVEPDAGAEGGLEEPRVRGGDAVPAERADEGAEVAGIIKTLAADALPSLAVHDLGVEFEFPDDFEFLALGVILEAGERYLRAVGRRLDGVHEPGPGAALHDLARGGQGGGRGDRLWREDGCHARFSLLEALCDTPLAGERTRGGPEA